jgi:hypothetical protein
MTDYLVFERNNMGVEHLINGDMNLALGFFRAAFDDAKTRCLLKSPSTGVGMVDTRISKYPLHWPLIPREQVIENLRSTHSNDCRRHGLTIGTNFIPHGSCGKANMTLAASFIVFNLGVVYSILGSREWNEPLLTKSRTLLDSCRRLLLSLCDNLEESETPIPSENPQVDLLWIMTLIKLAETNYLLSDFKQAEEHGARLSDFLCLIQLNQLYMIDPEVKDLMEVHVRSFMSNRRNMLPSLAAAA